MKPKTQNGVFIFEGKCESCGKPCLPEKGICMSCFNKEFQQVYIELVEETKNATDEN